MPQSWRPVREDRDRPGPDRRRSCARPATIVGSDHRAGPHVDRAVRRPTDDVAGARRRQPGPGSQGVEVVRADRRSRPARSARQWRLRRATAAISRSAATGPLLAVAERRLDAPDRRATMRREAVGLERRRVVGAGPRPIERQVLLDQRGAERGRGDRRARSRACGRTSRPGRRTRGAGSRSRGGSRRRRPPGSSRRSGTAPAAGRRRPRTASTAAATSTMSAMPGREQQRPAAAARGRRGTGGWSARPDPTLKAGTSSRSSRSADAVVERRRQEARSRARARAPGAPAQASAGRASRREHLALVARRDSPAVAGRRPSGAPAAASASGSKVWNLTASAPAVGRGVDQRGARSPGRRRG